MSPRILKQVLEYLIWLASGLFLLMICQAPTILERPWMFSLAFLYLLFLPGYLLGRLLRLTFQDLLSRIVIYFVLGLGFYCIFNLLAILTGITLGSLSKIILLFLILMLAGSFIYDWLKPLPEEKVSSLKNFWRVENLFYLLPALLAGFIFWLLSFQGPNLNGDPYFHLSIIRKAIEGGSLASRDLAFTKIQFINPAYVYPVWHVFLGFLSQTFSLSIFTVWSNVVYVLTALVILIWYTLAQVIFTKKIAAIIALVLMLIFTVYGGPGYLFSRLGVPDTLAQLVLLPLSWVLALKYILEPKQSLWPVLLASFIALVVHGPHFFYLILTIFLFGAIYALVHIKEQDRREVVWRIGKVLLGELAILAVLVVVLELRSRAFVPTLLEFYKASGKVIFSTSFSKFGLLYKYSYFLLPLLFIFVKSKRLIFLIAGMVLTPLIYWTPLKDIFNKILSGIFTDRLLANTGLYFFVLAVLLILILMLIDSWIARFSPNIRSLINAAILLIFVLLGFVEIQSQKVSDFIYLIFYAKPTNVYVNAHLFWFVLAGLLLALIFFGLLRRKIIGGEFNFQNKLTTFLLMVIVLFVLISPTIINAKARFKEPPPKRGQEYFVNFINDDTRALGYVRSLPQKSVILASGSASKGLATLADQYMAYNVGSYYEKNFKLVFDPGISDEEKTAIVTSPKWLIDYIYLDDPSLQNKYFANHPEIYQKIYAGKTEIYQMVK